jgi:F-type H+-transporting ATPase subunit b
MNSVIFLAAGNPVAEIAHQFGVTWQLLISQIVLFVIVAVALKKFAYQPILDMLEKRRQIIAESLSNADKIKAELASAQAKTQELLAQAGAQATKIIEEARAAAAKISEQEAQKAVVAAQDIVTKARQSNENEFKRLETELKREIGRLAVTAAMRVSGKILTAEDQPPDRRLNPFELRVARWTLRIQSK